MTEYILFGCDRCLRELDESYTLINMDDPNTIFKLQKQIDRLKNSIKKEEIWEERDLYIGSEVLFKYMDIGMKDLPRHPISIRIFKEDE